MTEVEGVIKFVCEHEPMALAPHDIAELRAWREVLLRLGMLGQDASRYGGYGFGNVSMRTGDGFLVSGSQTGHLGNPGLEAYSRVVSWDLGAGRIVSQGEVKPSSESLTHAAIYELSPSIRWVFHAHAPEIWRGAEQRSIAATPPDVAYGTPAMAAAVETLFPEHPSTGIFAMGGHEDGIIAFGETADAAGEQLIYGFVRAKTAEFSP